MKKLNLFKIVCFCAICGLFFSKNLVGQSLIYSYDESGNRIERSVSLTRALVIPEIEIDSTENVTKTETETLLSAGKKKDPFESKIYPNPTTGIFMVELPELGDKQKAGLSVYTKMGKKVKQVDKLQKTQSVDITNLSSDLYLLYITVDGETITRTLIKE